MSMSFYNVKTWAIIPLIIGISFFSRSENKVDARKALPQRQTVPQLSTFGKDQNKEQISQVVRMMFQDSKGNIWFGTENGAFRLENKVLVHIDSIRSESGKGSEALPKIKMV